MMGLDRKIRTLSNDTVRYRYDALGRRIWKQSGSDTVEYVWASGHVLFTISNGEVTEYSYYPGADRLHSMFKSDTFYYYFTDHLGSVIAIADSQGTVQNRYEYDTWGYIQNPTENVGNRFGFSGREYDSETGFYYFRARYYDPATGRFLSEDPIGLAGGLNPYAYAGNSPLSARDPSGLQGDLEEQDTTLVCYSSPYGPDPRPECNPDGLEATAYSFPSPWEASSNAYAFGPMRGSGPLSLSGSGGTTDQGQQQRQDEPQCLGGFPPSRCPKLLNGLEDLRISENETCAAAGRSATQRYKGGRMIYARRYFYKGEEVGGHAIVARGITIIADTAFTYMPWLRSVIAHEEAHHARWPESKVKRTGRMCTYP